jgi:hypothetical protein
VFIRSIARAISISTGRASQGSDGVSSPGEHNNWVPSGLKYHPRCPIGPLVYPERFVCSTDEPSPNHRNLAKCHFADLPGGNTAK